MAKTDIVPVADDGHRACWPPLALVALVALLPSTLISYEWFHTSSSLIPNSPDHRHIICVLSVNERGAEGQPGAEQH